MAPFTPFIAEEMYRNLTSEESVHLVNWPKVKLGLLDNELIEEMKYIRLLTNLGLKGRVDMGATIRYPKYWIKISKEIRPEFKEILKEELNVEDVLVDSTIEILAMDNTKDEYLDRKYFAREIIRAIQEGRKKAGFNVEDRISLGIIGSDKVFEEHLDSIVNEVLATSWITGNHIENPEYQEDITIDEESFSFSIKRK